MRNSFEQAEADNTGFLGNDFANISEGDLVFSGGHVRVSTGQTRTNDNGDLEIQFWHAPETGQNVQMTWQVPGANWTFGHTFRDNETILNSVTIEDENGGN